MCAMAGNVETMQVLLAVECNIASVDSEQHTAVHWAIGVFIYVRIYTSNAVPVLVNATHKMLDHYKSFNFWEYGYIYIAEVMLNAKVMTWN